MVGRLREGRLVQRAEGVVLPVPRLWRRGLNELWRDEEWCER